MGRGNRWAKKSTPKKPEEEKIRTSMAHFKVPDGTLLDGRYVVGFDPGKRNLGWAVFKIDNGEASYVGSGALKVKGDSKQNPLNKQIQHDIESILHIDEFLSKLFEDYDPCAICWEDTMGGGISTARTALGEVQGLIKLAGYSQNKSVIMLAAQTRCMETLLLGTSLKRDEKKIATSNKIKSMFPKQLESRKITKTGVFTHEADAIGCLYGLFRANGILMEGVQNERESDTTDGD